MSAIHPDKRPSDLIPELLRRHLDAEENGEAAKDVLSTGAFLLVLAAAAVLSILYGVTFGPLSH